MEVVQTENKKNNLTEAIWIGGWATNLVCWKSEFELLYPGWRHTFLDAMDPESVMQELKMRLAGNPSETLFVMGWSLGSLVLHQWLMEPASPANSDIKFASLNPVFDFCNPHNGWSSRVLEKMKRKLKREKKTVTVDFFNNMVKNVKLSKRQLDLWLDNASSLSSEKLESGLAYLAENQVDPQQFMEKNPKQIFFKDDKDPISPPLEINPEATDCVVPVAGHIPFLTDSQKIINTMEAR